MKGGFAKCYEVNLLPSGEAFAAKVIDKKTLYKPKTKQKLSTEIKIHRSLAHPYIVRFYSYFEDRQNVYILLEMCRCRVCEHFLFDILVPNGFAEKEEATYGAGMQIFYAPTRLRCTIYARE